MSDTENNNTSEKVDADPRASSPLRMSRKRTASADLDNDLVQDEDDEDSLHFKQRPSSAEQRSNYDYGSSGNPMDTSVGHAGAHDERSSSVSSVKEDQLLLKDISMLREDRVKREKYWKEFLVTSYFPFQMGSAGLHFQKSTDKTNLTISMSVSFLPSRGSVVVLLSWSSPPDWIKTRVIS